MNKHFFFLYLIIHFLVNVCFSAHAATYPQTRWKQYKTAHFIVVYPKTINFELVQKVGILAEDAQKNISTFLNYNFKNPTYLILKDHTDQFNGSATLIPHRVVTLYLAPTLNGSGLWDTRTSEDLKLLIHHELTHIAHLDTKDGFFKVMSKVFGPIFSPNLYLPPNIPEGFAVYSETEYENGRGMGSFYNMVLRTDVLEHQLKALDKTVAFNRNWNSGTITYLYGYKFLDYLAKTYGKEKLAELSHSTGKRFPYFLSGAFLQVYNKRFETLWQEWTNTLPAVYEAQRQQILADGETKSETLFHSHGFISEPALSPNQDDIYFSWHGRDNYPALISLNLKTAKRETLSKGKLSGKISPSFDGRKIYYAKFQPYRNFSYFSDLYVYDLNKKKEQRLSKGLRANDVAIDSNGQELVYVRQNQGNTFLEKQNLISKEIFTFPQPEKVFLWHSPVFSKEGTLYVLGQTLDGHDQIYIWNGENWNKLQISANWISGLSLSPDGLQIYFSTDVNGTANIYSYSLTEHLQTRRTSVASGAFSGVSDGENIYFSKYTSSGFDLEKIPSTDHFGENIAVKNVEVKNIFETPKAANPSEISKEKTYNPFPQLLRPYIILPVVGKDEQGWQAGLYLTGADSLLHHQYQIQATYGFESQRPSYEIEYIYDRLFPTISLATFDNNNAISKIFQNASGEEIDYLERKRGGKLQLSFPLFSRDRSEISLETSYLFQHLSSLTSPLPTPVPFEGNNAAISAGLKYHFLETHRYAVWPAKGATAEGTVEFAHKKIGGDFNRKRYVAQTSFFIPSFFQRHVLKLSGLGGISSGETLPQGDFKLGGDGNLSFLRPENDSFALRGYPSQSLVGSRFAKGQTEYRLPLFFVERGIRHWPFYLDCISLVNFYELGSAWNVGQNKVFHDSVGAEIQTAFTFAYHFDTKLKIGLARGLRETGTTSFYINFGSSL